MKTLVNILNIEKEAKTLAEELWMVMADVAEDDSLGGSSDTITT